MFKTDYSSHKKSWVDCASELSPPDTQRTSADCVDLASNITPKKQLQSHTGNQIKRKQLTPRSFKYKENDVMQTSVHWEMLRLRQKVLSTALSQWMVNMTSDLCSSPMSLLFTFVQEYRFHLYSWLQQPLRDGYHQKKQLSASTTAIFSCYI